MWVSLVNPTFVCCMATSLHLQKLREWSKTDPAKHPIEEWQGLEWVWCCVCSLVMVCLIVCFSVGAYSFGASRLPGIEMLVWCASMHIVDIMPSGSQHRPEHLQLLSTSQCNCKLVNFRTGGWWNTHCSHVRKVLPACCKISIQFVHTCPRIFFKTMC